MYPPFADSPGQRSGPLHAEWVQGRYGARMPKTIQIRDVDDETYRVLRSRAAAEGLSLTAYLKRELDRMAGPTMGEWIDRALKLEGRVDREEIVRIIREGRDLT
jgi:plasmid stability protein